MTAHDANSTATATASKYWNTAVSEITPETVYIRGYRLEDLIGTSFTTTTFLMIKGRLPSPAEAKVLDAILTSVLDYGLEKSGTAAARFVVSCNPQVQAGLAAAVLGAGDYALATENTAQFIVDTHRRFQAAEETDLDTFAAQVVADASATKFRIPGFGHPVFRHVDPRAAVLKQIAVDQGLWGESLQLYEAVHRAFIQQRGREHFPINDVGVLAAISVALGFTPKESTALAVLGTLPGVVAHITEELESKKVVRRIPAADVDYQVGRRSLADDLTEAGW